MSNAFALRNGTILLSTEAPGGIYNSVQLKKIAALCDGDMAIVRATEDQRLALFVKESAAARVAQELKAIGLGVRHYQSGLHQPVSCVGELCPDHEQDAMGSAMAVSKALEALVLESPLKIGINGCARCCVPCHTFDVSVVGDASGYRVSLGGKNSQLPEVATFMAEGIPAAKLPALLTHVVVAYRDHAQSGESLQDVMERVGTGPFVGALAPYSQDASADVGDPFAVPEADLGAETAPDATFEGETPNDAGAEAPADDFADATPADGLGDEASAAALDAGSDAWDAFADEEFAPAPAIEGDEGHDDLDLGEAEEIAFPESETETAQGRAIGSAAAWDESGEDEGLIEDFAGVSHAPQRLAPAAADEGFDIDPRGDGMSRDLASDIPIGRDGDAALGADIPMGHDDDEDEAFRQALADDATEADTVTPGQEAPEGMSPDHQEHADAGLALGDEHAFEELGLADDGGADPEEGAGAQDAAFTEDFAAFEEIPLTEDDAAEDREAVMADAPQGDAIALSAAELADAEAAAVAAIGEDEEFLGMDAEPEMLDDAAETPAADEWASAPEAEDASPSAASWDVGEAVDLTEDAAAVTAGDATESAADAGAEAEELRTDDPEATSLSEDDESDFEANFSRVIEEESVVPDVSAADENVDERAAALDVLANAHAHAPAARDESWEAAVGSIADFAANLEPEELAPAAASEDEELLATPATEVPGDLARMTADMAESWNETRERDGAGTRGQNASRKADVMKNAANLSLASFHVSDDGKLRLAFDSGMAISFDPKTMRDGKRTITVAGQPVTITRNDEGYQLELDGVELFYPAA